METCPICKKKVEDMRHLRLDCFYAIEEFVSTLQKEVIFKQVPMKGGYWGTTRTYRKGTKDKHITKQHPIKENTFITTTKQIPIKDVRLLEVGAYYTDCCKSCRGDFLSLFKRFMNGEFVEEK